MPHTRQQRLFAITLVLIIMVMSLLSVTSIASQSRQDNDLTIGLNHYHIVHHQTLPDVTQNLSGITYASDSDSLFAVINNPEQIIELDKQGRILRTIQLQNFVDTEGITYLGKQQFAITQERDRSVTLVEISHEATQLNAHDHTHFNLQSTNTDNLGLEGIAWAANTGMFIANEKSPAEVVHIPMPFFTGMPQRAKHYGGILPHYYKNLPLNDISGLHFSEQTQQLLVLSHESRRLISLDVNGAIQSQFNFDPWLFGLGRDIEQPEGVTMDTDGQIYIVGEPNILLVMAPR